MNAKFIFESILTGCSYGNELLFLVMDAKYLDWALNTVGKAKNGEVKRIFADEQFQTDLPTALTLLTSKGYIGQYINKVEFDKNIWNVSITPEGQAFIADGGFTHEKLVRESSLHSNRIANEANDIAAKANLIALKSTKIAWWSLGVAAAAVIVSIIAIKYATH